MQFVLAIIAEKIKDAAKKIIAQQPKYAAKRCSNNRCSETYADILVQAGAESAQSGSA